MEKITINNFRKVKETWGFNLAPITFFTGTNNSGKSSVLKALMLLDGFGNSKNHFVLNFNGKHSRNHKIDCFSNAINRQNLKENLNDVHFSIENKDYYIDYHFYPLESVDNRFGKGKLKTIKFTSKYDNSIFSISNLAGDEYQLTIDNSFIHGKKVDERDNDLIIFKEIKNENEKELKEKEAILNSLDENSTKRIFYLNSVISLKDKLKNLNKRIKEIENKNTKDNQQFNPTFYLKEFEGDESFDRILRRVLNKYFKDNEKKIGLTDTNREMFRISMLADVIVDSLNLNISHLTPNRNTQTRLYVNESGNNDIYDIIKSLSENPIRKKSKADIFIKKWMSKEYNDKKYFDIGEDYEIKPIEGLASKIDIQENGDWINLVDKGFGAGQIFTILLRIADVINQGNDRNSDSIRRRFRKSTPVILIEEPEANLHPAFQSLLAELFIETWEEFGIQFIVETHSEYIIRKSQLLFMKYAFPDGKNPRMSMVHNPFAVYYFDEAGPYEMKYRNDGSFNKQFGEGFLDVVDDIALEIFLKNNKQ